MQPRISLVFVFALSLSIAAALGVAAGCTSSSSSSSGPIVARMDFTRPDFFAAPFPSDDLVGPDGSVNLAAYPNPNQNLFFSTISALAASDARGFATTAGLFFSFTGDLDPTSLPDLAHSTDADASVFVMSVDPGAPDNGKMYPASIYFQSDPGDFGAPHFLSIVPLAGIPLRARTTYAAVVTTKVVDANNGSLTPSPEVAQIFRGETPTGMSATVLSKYTLALQSILAALASAPPTIAALSVFTTGDPTAQMISATSYALSQPLPALTLPITNSGEDFAGFCVYNTQLDMPDYQSGTPPFSSTGGNWTFDASGNPIVQRVEPARIVITIPKAPMPAAGYPLTMLIRTGAGGDRPLVDRGVQPATGEPAITPGTGPASEFAKVGYAGVQIDGPLGGLRNPDPSDNEDYLIFNVSNGAALRDNIRETALETAVFERVLEGITFNASDCTGVGSAPVKFDKTKFALMGHSMGATIAPLALAVTPEFLGAVLSGAGASWIENVLFKQQPLDVRPLIETLFDYPVEHRTLTRADPALSLLQWAIEAADPLVYTRSLIAEPRPNEVARQILMEQGIVDHYILPPIANATSLSLGLDLAGTELDTTAPELVANPDLTPLANVIQFSGRKNVSFPVIGNISTSVTAFVVQHPSDGIEDGHEVMFQTEPPKNEYRCFLQTLAQGGAARVQDGNTGATCP